MSIEENESGNGGNIWKGDVVRVCVINSFSSTYSFVLYLRLKL